MFIALAPHGLEPPDDLGVSKLRMRSPGYFDEQALDDLRKLRLTTIAAKL